MLQCIDKVYQEIDTRCKRMECILDRFEILDPTSLIETSETELSKLAQSLMESYDELSAKMYA